MLARRFVAGRPMQVASRKLKRRLRVRDWIAFIFCAALVSSVTPLLTSWLPIPDPFNHPDQDQCTFGPVSNPEYLAMLAKAKAIQRWHWLGTKPAEEIRSQFEEVAAGNPSPYIKIAAMHAVLRGLGADFRHTIPSNAAFSYAAERAGAVSYHYALAVPRLGVFSGWPGHAWLIGQIGGPINSYEKTRQGEVDFIIWYPKPIIDVIPSHALARGNVSCPPTPPQDLASSFAGPP